MDSSNKIYATTFPEEKTTRHHRFMLQRKYLHWVGLSKLASWGNEVGLSSLVYFFIGFLEQLKRVLSKAFPHCIL
jgi:hypothetical protein